MGMDLPSADQARSDLGGIVGSLFSAFSLAIEEAADYVRVKGLRDQSFFSHQVRYLAKAALKAQNVDTAAEGEDSEVEDTANTGVCISTPGYLTRVLKSAPGGLIPDPGGSERRRRFLDQKNEDQYPLFPEDSQDPPGVLPEPVHLVFLWETDNRNAFTGFWFICPLGVGRYEFREWLPYDGLAGMIDVPILPEPHPAPPVLDDLSELTKREEQKEQTGTDENAR